MFADFIQHNYSEVQKRSEITRVIGQKLRDMSYAARSQKHEDPQKQSDSTTVVALECTEVQKGLDTSTDEQNLGDDEI